MNRLKQLRIENGKNQEDIYTFMQVAKSTYSYWENGRTEPDHASLLKLANYYNTTVDYLLGRDEAKTQQATEADNRSKLEKELSRAGLKEKVNKLSDEQMKILINAIENFKDTQNK